MTTEPTTTAMPSWIDFDIIVPKELHQEAAQLTAEFGIILNQLRPIIERFAALESALCDTADHATAEIMRVGVAEGSRAEVGQALRVVIDAVVGWEETFVAAAALDKLFEGQV